MAILANSYGDTGEVAAMQPRFANSSGIFDTTTRPTLLQVESFIDQVSGVLNIQLAAHGFSVPVSQADAKLGLDLFVNQEVAAIVEGVNGSGRFGPTQRQVQASRYSLILKDVAEFLEATALGLERLGATRSEALLDGMAYRDTDESGSATFPIFQRKGFGGETFTDNDQ